MRRFFPRCFPPHRVRVMMLILAGSARVAALDAEGARQLLEAQLAPARLHLPWNLAVSPLVSELLPGASGAHLLQGAAAQADSAILPVHRVTYHVAGIALCDWETKLVTLPDGHTVRVGAIPASPTPHPAPVFDLSLAQARDTAAAHLGWTPLPTLTVERHSRCWSLGPSGELSPAYLLHWRRNDEGFTRQLVVTEHEVRRSVRLIFDLSGEELSEATAYASGPVDSQLETFDVPVFTASETLENQHFRTTLDPLIAKLLGLERATRRAGGFAYTPGEPQFSEVSIFTNANRMLDYFQNMGYVWSEKTPMILKAWYHSGGSQTTVGDVNNALYEPESATPHGAPQISVGIGDSTDLASIGIAQGGEFYQPGDKPDDPLPRGLRNMAVDADVVFHEFSHHIVYRHLSTINSVTVVIHEGLADFFTFAATGNPCLGESLCPAQSRTCVIEGRCLRTAENTLQYGDETYTSLALHQRGQVLSSLLMDLNSQLGGVRADVLLFNALPYLPSSAGFGELIISLLLADRALTSGNNACQITDAFAARGFAPFLEGINCQDPATFDSSLRSDPSDKRRFLGLRCGTTGTPPRPGPTLLLFLLTSLVLAAKRRPRRRIRST